MTMLYNNTKTIFAVAFFHAVGSVSYEIFPVIPTKESPALTGFIVITVIYYIAAILAILIFDPKKLKRNT